MHPAIRAEIDRLLEENNNIDVQVEIPPDAEVHFFGNRILALDPALNTLNVPREFRRHRLVQDRYFCTLPRDFWDLVYNGVGPERFDPQRVELEVALSDICGDHSHNAGFRNGLPFVYCLRRQPMQFSAADVQILNMNEAQLGNIARIAEERTAGMARTTRAYAGWLMTNPQFLGELDGLLETWADMVRRWGFDRLGIIQLNGMYLPGDDPAADPRWADYRSAFEEFFTRWRLRGMAAPYLPIPLEPGMSGQFPVSVLPQVMRSGGAFVLPDTCSVPSRDELRWMLDDSLHRGPAPEHLTEWMELVARDNTAKKPFIMFERLFELQHYFRLLHHRHAPALQRKLIPVKEVLATFLGVSKRTVDGDLQFINRRLGSAWVQRGKEC